MVRKRRPQIAGRDPEYTSDFSTKLPTNMPQEVKPPEVAAPKAAPKQQDIPAPSSTTTTQAKKPGAKRSTPKPAAKPVKQKPKPSAKMIASEEGTKRQIALTSAITVEHNKKLEALSKHGIAAKDAMSLAGRRAIERFEPQPKYVEKPDADRMPMRQGYKTTKTVDAKLIDGLREKHDPLKLLSDGAMLRGQFEPLFWNCMDEVIAELNKRFG